MTKEITKMDELEASIQDALQAKEREIIVEALAKQIGRNTTIKDLMTLFSHKMLKNHLEDVRVRDLFDAPAVSHSSSTGEGGRERGKNVLPEDNAKQEAALLAGMKAAGKGSKAEVLAKVRVQDPALAADVEKRWNILTAALKEGKRIDKEGDKQGAKWFVVAQGQPTIKKAAAGH